jgi:hypothetical protein
MLTARLVLQHAAHHRMLQCDNIAVHADLFFSD